MSGFGVWTAGASPGGSFSYAESATTVTRTTDSTSSGTHSDTTQMFSIMGQSMHLTGLTLATAGDGQSWTAHVNGVSVGAVSSSGGNATWTGLDLYIPPGMSVLRFVIGSSVTMRYKDAGRNTLVGRLLLVWDWSGSSAGNSLGFSLTGELGTFTG